MIDCLFLDAGGVILNEDSHEQARAAIITELLKNYNPGFTSAAYWECVEEAAFRFCPNVYDYIIWNNVPSATEYHQAKELLKLKWEALNLPLILMEGMQEVIPVLASKYQLGILGQYGEPLLALLQSHSLLDYFTFQTTQDDFQITKPEPRYFEQVLSKAGVEPVKSAMVGDRIDKDVIPARLIGMKTVRIKTGIHRNQKPRTLEEIPDCEYDSVAGLVNLGI